jgi:hypothetical protein
MASAEETIVIAPVAVRRSDRLRSGSALRLATAYATLERGTAFLARSLEGRADVGTQALTGPGGAKVVGNGLRELDRFLSLLLDAAADGIDAADLDRSAFARQNNVANKIDLFYRLAGGTPPDVRRLRAIGRVRACLHHCRGIVHDSRLWEDLRLATGSDPSMDLAKAAERLNISFVELSEICRFYAQCGDDLIALRRVNRSIP